MSARHPWQTGRSAWRLLVLIGGLGGVTSGGEAQAPPPIMVRAGSTSVVSLGSSPVGAPVPLGQVKQIEEALATRARHDALGIAATYARSNPATLRGVRELGRQLMNELAKPRPDFDFAGVVSHNPAFWLAERELAPGDVSLPYLVSMLAILGRDYVTAARCIALAQATLPLTPTVRRGYAVPEAMMLYLDQLLLWGIPASARMQTAEQCETSMILLRTRIAKWSNRPGLLRALIELEVRRVELLTQGGKHGELLDQRISERLNLEPGDLAFARGNDPILASGFDATVRQWLNQMTLAQRWSRWIERGDPADLTEVEVSVTAYAANGRPDLAWLTWRSGLAMRGIAAPAELRRWTTWCEGLLDAKSAAYVEEATAANRMAGQASMPIENEGFSEAWSGDQRIHPLLAVKIERQIALVDTMLSVVPPGSDYECNYRMKRAQLLAQIDAIENSRRELRRIRQIVGDAEQVMVMKGVKAMETIKILEARLLDSEGHYTAAQQLYEELLRNPNLEELKGNYAVHLYMAGSLREAHNQYRACALAHPDDTYRAIMADLTARRLGQREIELLQAVRTRMAPDSWPAAGLRFLLAELTEDELLALARQGTTFEIIDHECEAYFWLGELALAEGRKDDGIKWLTRCLGTGFMTNVEYKIAKAELERLAPDEKPKKSGPENSPGVITT